MTGDILFMMYKTQQDNRLPTEYFLPAKFANETLLRDEKRFFFQKVLILHQLLYFFKLESLRSFAKSLTIELRKKFSRDDVVSYVFCRKFATLTDLEVNQFLPKNPIFFENEISYVFENSYCFGRFLRQTCNTSVVESFSIPEWSDLGQFHLGLKCEKKTIDFSVLVG